MGAKIIIFLKNHNKKFSYPIMEKDCDNSFFHSLEYLTL